MCTLTAGGLITFGSVTRSAASNARAALTCASMMLAALSSFPAVAELPTHRRVALLGPTAAEAGLPNEEGLPNSPDFGAAVAIRNGIAFVGIPAAAPVARVAVYTQTATAWVRTATLTVPDAPLVGAVHNGFGRAITFRDGLAVIASDRFVHVFKRVNGVWTDVQKLAPPPKGSPTDFWEISAMRYENGILAIGSSSSVRDSVVYLYELAPTGKFVRRATLRAPGGFPGDRFGSSVGVAGTTVAVGGGIHNAAYVFRRRSDGTWVRTQTLVAADSSPESEFGSAVAIDRGMIIVGAPSHDCVGGEIGVFCRGGGSPDGSAAGGAAYGFVPIGGRYVQVFKLRPGSDQHFNYWQFGRRIAMFGKHIVIDAAEQSFVGDPDVFGFAPGLSFSYIRDGSTLTARGITSGYIQSDSMGLANNWLLVGSTHDLATDSFCSTLAMACFGEAHIFDLNRFVE